MVYIIYGVPDSTFPTPTQKKKNSGLAARDHLSTRNQIWVNMWL